MQLLQVVQLGQVDYATALRLQETLVELRKAGRIADTLLLLEHPPVITMGRNSRSENIVAAPEALARLGVDVHEINRGGDVTYHGPGQLLGYPIVDLRAATPKLGVVEFVRKLEEALIRTCGEYSVPSQRVQGLTGVWTTDEPTRKLAAIGIHVSRGVTSHGFALNVTTELDAFQLIVPCGISDKPVTSLERELGQPATPGGRKLDLQNVSEMFTRQYGRVFGTQILWLESLDGLLNAQEPVP